MSDKKRMRFLEVETSQYIYLYRADSDGEKHLYGIITGDKMSTMAGRAIEWIGSDRNKSAQAFYWAADADVPTTGPFFSAQPAYA